MRKLLKQAVSILAIVSIAGTTLPINVSVSRAKNIETEEAYIIMTEQQKLSDQIADSYEGEQLDENSKMISVDLTKSEAKLLDSRNGIIIEKDLLLEGSDIESESTEPTDSILPVMEGQIDNPWNMEAIGVTANDQNPRKVKVELLDSGVSAALDIDITENVDLVHKAEEYNPLFVDDNGHGTAIAGVMCAKDDNSGIVGINPNMELYSVKALDANNQSPLSRIVEGIYWGIEHDVDIINMSFGTTKDSGILHQAIRDAAERGIMMIAAAGNSMHKEVQYPAAYPEVIAVGSIGTDGKLAEETSVGTSLELLAPGEAIITNGFYSIPVLVEGSSIATAQVTGVASLLYGRTQNNQNAIVRGVLAASAKEVSVPDNVTAGVIDYNCAEEIFDDYVETYQDNAQEEYDDYQNDGKMEDYTDIAEEQVHGLWGESAHKNMLNSNRAYFSADQLSIIREASSKPDDVSIKNGAAAELHGAANYVAHLKYLWYLSVFIGRENTGGTDAGVTTAIVNARKSAKAKLANTSVASDANYQHLTDSSGALIRASLKSGDSKTAQQLQLIVWGYACHLIGDVYAHRAAIPKSTVANKSGKFIENQFLVTDFKKFKEFKKNYQGGRMEYRLMKYYCKDKNVPDINAKYIDSLTFFKNRGKNAQNCINLLISSGYNKDGDFSSAFIFPFRYPQNSKLRRLRKNCQAAGVTSEVPDAYTVEGEDPKISGR